MSAKMLRADRLLRDRLVMKQEPYFLREKSCTYRQAGNEVSANGQVKRSTAGGPRSEAHHKGASPVGDFIQNDSEGVGIRDWRANCLGSLLSSTEPRFRDSGASSPQPRGNHAEGCVSFPRQEQHVDHA